tara:strand:+ start:1299 stop:1511 length:213 start_codon:yes stop_codon:yes gene_type:complete
MDGQGELWVSAGNIALADDASKALNLLPGDYVMVSIRDTKRGILPDHLSRIFEPFFTTKELTGARGLASA